MGKAFAEVEEQDIPISDAQGRMISPLVYTSQCVDRNIYPCEFSCQSHEDRILTILFQMLRRLSERWMCLGVISWP